MSYLLKDLSVWAMDTGAKILIELDLIPYINNSTKNKLTHNFYKLENKQ